MDKTLNSTAFKKLVFYFDQTKCGGCNTCTVACKDWNQVNPGPVAWRKQFTYEVDTAEGKRFFPLAMSCNHCDRPPCVEACPQGAITKDANNGIVTVNREVCIGVTACIPACPFGKLAIADDKQEPTPSTSWVIKHPVQKCTACADDRLKFNLKPACVASCVGRALDFGTAEYITTTYPDAVQLNPTDFPYAYVNNQDDTGPNFFVKKMDELGGLGGLTIHRSASYTGKY